MNLLHTNHESSLHNLIATLRSVDEDYPFSAAAHPSVSRESQGRTRGETRANERRRLENAPRRNLFADATATRYRDALGPLLADPAIDAIVAINTPTAVGDTLGGDLNRRDFTINAMAVSIPDKKFVDPYGGLSDLAHRVLRTPATPESSFSDDPLRMMRAARFVAQLGFRPDPEVVAAMRGMTERISIISAERIRDELSKLLLTDRPRPGIDLLVSTGLAAKVLPELPALRLERDEHHRHKDVYQHSLTVLEQAIDLEDRLPERPDLIIRLAALLHDIGKPATRRFEPGGKVSFHHHDVVGAKLVRKRLAALRFSGEEIKAVSELVALHLRFHGYSGDEGRAGVWTDSAVRRYVRDAGDQLARLHVLTRADCTTRDAVKAERLRAAYDDLERRIAELAAQEELKAIRPDLNGSQIMEILGIPEGRDVGRAYAFLMERRLEDGPLGEEHAREELLAWWADQHS